MCIIVNKYVLQINPEFRETFRFTLIEQVSTIHITNKDTLNFRLKRHEDFWIEKLETLTTKGLNQESKNV